MTDHTNQRQRAPIERPGYGLVELHVALHADDADEVRRLLARRGEGELGPELIERYVRVGWWLGGLVQRILGWRRRAALPKESLEGGRVARLDERGAANDDRSDRAA